jgi:hypothetical protein
MRPTEKIEKLVRKFEIDANARKDQKTLDELMQAHANSKRVRQSATSANTWRIIKFSAAAVVVVLAACWFIMSDRGEPKQHQTNRSVVAANPKTPVELVSVISLNMVFRDGGMKAMEKQLDKAERKIKPELRLTIDQLICELEECEKI